MHLLVIVSGMNTICDHHSPQAARHLLCIELIWLLIVACGMLSHSSGLCEVVGFWQEVEQTVVHVVPGSDEWHNNGPQDLVTVSLCIQNCFSVVPSLYLPKP